MNRYEAMKYVENVLHYDLKSQRDWLALVRIRHRNLILPEYGIDYSARDDSEWALIDMTEKIDTRLYGSVYYFGGKEDEEETLKYDKF